VERRSASLFKAAVIATVGGSLLGAGIVVAQPKPPRAPAGVVKQPGLAGPQVSAAVRERLTAPMLTGVRWLRGGALDFGVQVQLVGLNLGSQQGQKVRLVRKGSPAAVELKVVRWTDSAITVLLEARHKPTLFRGGTDREGEATIGLVATGGVGWASSTVQVRVRSEPPVPARAAGPIDGDGDGHFAWETGGDDCDDGDAARYPGAGEVCDADGLDEDCDPVTVGDRDADSDGYIDCRCTNITHRGQVTARNCDCDDQRAGVHHGLPDVCDGLDNDCDGSIDENAGLLVFRDTDGDGFGDPRARIRACDVAPGISALGNDCDDRDAKKSPLAGCP